MATVKTLRLRNRAGDQLDLTPAQAKAWALLARKTRILLFGGARSGKTVILCLYIIVRLMTFPGARIMIARWRFIHAKQSIWSQTLIPLLDRFWKDQYTVDKSDYIIRFKNGSELWLGGLDDKERTEKLLGQEYLDIYLNEVSQISYAAMQIVLTRLAQVVPGARNKAYFDCNPPSPMHWAHRLFIENIEPKDRVPVRDPGRFGRMLMNPMDNRANLPPGFIDGLRDLSRANRDRMLWGKWVKPEGAVYEIADAVIIKAEDVPPLWDFTVGVDFGMHPAAVLIGWDSDRVYILDDVGEYNWTAPQLDEAIKEMTLVNWTLLRRPDGTDAEGDFWYERNRDGGTILHRAPPPMQYIAYGDPAGGERIQQITNCRIANNAVDPGIDCLRTLLQHDNLRITTRSTGVLSEVHDYRRDENGKIVKENDHFCDAQRYGIFTRKGSPQPRVRRL